MMKHDADRRLETAEQNYAAAVAALGAAQHEVTDAVNRHRVAAYELTAATEELERARDRVESATPDPAQEGSA